MSSTEQILKSALKFSIKLKSGTLQCCANIVRLLRIVRSLVAFPFMEIIPSPVLV